VNLTRFWTITVDVPEGALPFPYSCEHEHKETFGTSTQAFWRLFEIRSMMNEGILPRLRIRLMSEPAHRVA